jgi:rubredoxin
VEKYKCTVCGYIYDPVAGDPDASVNPGTAFDDLPADWVCPVCGSGKEVFEKESQA